MVVRRTKNDTAFGASVSNALAEAQLNQVDLAKMTGKSVSYVNQTLTGTRSASAGWVNLVASTLKLQNERKAELHRAAAKDLGYELDLTKE